MHRLHSTLLILLALWLPLQAVAAWMMPFCTHAVAPAHEEAQAMPAHCQHEVAGMPSPAAIDFDCDNCEACHLATAGYMLSSPAPLVGRMLRDSYPVGTLAAFPSHIPEPPRRPPRHLA